MSEQSGEFVAAADTSTEVGACRRLLQAAAVGAALLLPLGACGDEEPPQRLWPGFGYASSSASPGGEAPKVEAGVPAGSKVVDEALIESFKLSPEQKQFMKGVLADILTMEHEKFTSKGQKPTVNLTIMLAQAIHETGWGTSELARNANNLFGVKTTSDWKGESYTVRTSEYDANGQQIFINDDFRKYPTRLAGMGGYVDKVNRETWYRDAVERADDPVGYLNGLMTDPGNKVWATDPNYVSKVMRYVNDYRLGQLVRGQVAP